MPTPNCHRLYRGRLLDPDVCPCAWGRKAVNNALARIMVGLTDDPEWMSRMATISALMVESS